MNDLVDVLFREEYFGFKESSKAYVQNIVDAVEDKIRTENHKRTPRALFRYGEFYVSYKTTKRTAWYVFFSRKDNRVFINYITNNHVADASFLEHL